MDEPAEIATPLPLFHALCWMKLNALGVCDPMSVGLGSRDVIVEFRATWAIHSICPYPGLR